MADNECVRCRDAVMNGLQARCEACRALVEQAEREAEDVGGWEVYSPKVNRIVMMMVMVMVMVMRMMMMMPGSRRRTV
jgi:hypothetical protein